MDQICIMNIKLNGKPMNINQLNRYFDDPNIYRRLRTNMNRRQLYHKDQLITWELFKKVTYWLADGVKYDNKAKMANDVRVNYHSLKPICGKEWKYAGITFQKIVNIELYTENVDESNPVTRKKLETLIEIMPTYDKIEINGIQLVRKFIGDNLAKTYSYERGQKYLQA